jgi:hypothetical protein
VINFFTDGFLDKSILELVYHGDCEEQTFAIVCKKWIGKASSEFSVVKPICIPGESKAAKYALTRVPENFGVKCALQLEAFTGGFCIKAQYLRFWDTAPHPYVKDLLTDLPKSVAQIYAQRGEYIPLFSERYFEQVSSKVKIRVPLKNLHSKDTVKLSGTIERSGVLQVEEVGLFRIIDDDEEIIAKPLPATKFNLGFFRGLIGENFSFQNYNDLAIAKEIKPIADMYHGISGSDDIVSKHIKFLPTVIRDFTEA